VLDLKHQDGRACSTGLLATCRTDGGELPAEVRTRFRMRYAEWPPSPALIYASCGLCEPGPATPRHPGFRFDGVFARSGLSASPQGACRPLLAARPGRFMAA